MENHIGAQALRSISNSGGSGDLSHASIVSDRERPKVDLDIILVPDGPGLEQHQPHDVRYRGDCHCRHMTGVGRKRRPMRYQSAVSELLARLKCIFGPAATRTPYTRTAAVAGISVLRSAFRKSISARSLRGTRWTWQYPP